MGAFRYNILVQCIHSSYNIYNKTSPDWKYRNMQYTTSHIFRRLVVFGYARVSRLPATAAIARRALGGKLVIPRGLLARGSMEWNSARALLHNVRGARAMKRMSATPRSELLKSRGDDDNQLQVGTKLLFETRRANG